MFSPLKMMNVKLSEEMNGTIIEATGTKAKIHIPVLMQNIQADKPVEKMVKTNGLSVFKNTQGRPNISGPTIKEKNYFVSNTVGSKDSVNIQEAVNLVGQNITQWVSPEYATSKKVSVSYNVSKKSIVRCKFLNSKLTKLSYTLTENSTNASTSIKK